MKKFSVATLNLLNADVPAFQELWHAESLKNAFSHLSLQDPSGEALPDVQRNNHPFSS